MRQIFFHNINFSQHFFFFSLLLCTFSLSANAKYYCPSDGDGGRDEKIYSHYIIDVVKHKKKFNYVNKKGKAKEITFKQGFRGGCKEASSCKEESAITKQAIKAWKQRLISRLQGKGIKIENIRTSNVVGKNDKIIPSIWWGDVGGANDSKIKMQYPPIAEFKNGRDARLDMSDGIVLITGETQDVFGLNIDDNAEDSDRTHGARMNRNVYFKDEKAKEYVTDYIVPEIRDLVDKGAKKNSVFLEFDVTLDSGSRLLLVDYQFGSEEYPEHVGKKLNDAFGIFLYGGDLNKTYNIARIVSGGETRVTTENIQSFPTVSIGTINSGKCGVKVDRNSKECRAVENNERTYKASNYYLPNSAVKKGSNYSLSRDNMCIHADGLSRRMPAVLDNLTPGETYTLKIAIAEKEINADDTLAFIYKIRTAKGPSLCYDYAYSQNGRYFTKDNSGTMMPRIVGNIEPNDDIDVTLYIRGRTDKDSDESLLLEIENFKLNIVDINTSEATYKRNSVFVAEKNKIIPKHILDTALSVSDESVANIPIAEIGSKDYIYAYYTLKPKGINDINISLNATISYDAKFKYPVGKGEFIEIDASRSAVKIGSEQLPLCSGEITRYEPGWGAYNVGAKGIYKKHSSTNRYPKFNIPTQVVKRAGEFVITSHNKEEVDGVPFIKESVFHKQGSAGEEDSKTFTVVGLETINAGKFHDAKASCGESSAAASQRVWIPFAVDRDPVSQVDITPFLQKAISSNVVSLDNVKDFFSKAIANAAFRVLANTKNKKASLENGGSLIFHKKTVEGKYKIVDIKDIIKAYDNRCSVKNYASALEKIDTACKEDGMSFYELNKCHECLRGLNTISICSRDNFAVRPESFYVKISDQNQSDKTKTKAFSEDRTGRLNPNTDKTDIATGYAYKIEINATAHEASNQAVQGYTYNHFSGAESNVTFIWKPSDPRKNTTCYAKNSYEVPVAFRDGEAISLDANVSDIGKYVLNVIDKKWTKVDYDLAKMSHHREILMNGESKNVTKFFANGINTADCVVGSHEVLPSVDPKNRKKYNLPFVKNDIVKNINGCDINSDNHNVMVSGDHNNTSTVWRYRDYKLTAHPYKFSITSSPTHGSDRNTSFTNAWGYMSDLDDNITQAIHLESTIITAQSYTEDTVKNFSRQCYSQDVNLSIAYNENPEPNPTRALQYKKRLSNAKQDMSVPININKSSFVSGLSVIDIDINYERDKTTPVNPAKVELESINTSCKNDMHCTMQANLTANHIPTGTELVDRNISLFFGRVWGDSVVGYSPIRTGVNYEIYCDTLTGCVPTLYGAIFGGANPVNGKWIINMSHMANDGNVSNIVASKHPSKTSIKRTPLSGNYIVSGVENGIILSSPNLSQGYADLVKMTTNSWLINSDDISAVTSDFAVVFLGVSSWAGQGQLGKVVDKNVSMRPYRRMDW